MILRRTVPFFSPRIGSPVVSPKLPKSRHVLFRKRDFLEPFSRLPRVQSWKQDSHGPVFQRDRNLSVQTVDEPSIASNDISTGHVGRVPADALFKQELPVFGDNVLAVFHDFGETDAGPL